MLEVNQGGMFVTVLTYRARPGEQDAVVALHEDWQRKRRSTADGFIAGELLYALNDPQTFFDVARFETEEAARFVTANWEQDAGYRRLASLCEAEPVFTDCQVAWQGR
ncbi:MAG: antibiotic biosynthesis monooxygenase [Candidatus Dormiibacterota bacterium]